MRVSKITRVALDRLRINEGQLDWLPKNPRTWTQTDIDRMVRSIEEDPDFADVRPVLAVPGEGKELIVFAHNLLTRAAQVRGDRDLPVAVFEPETDEDRETVRRLAIKDNGSFGSWDTDLLANEWNADPGQLEGWGVQEWITGGAGSAQQQGSGSSGSAGKTGEINPDELKKTVPLLVELTAEEFSFVMRVLNENGSDAREGLLKLCGYVSE